MSEHVTTAIVAIVSSLGTYFATRIQSQYSLRSKRLESDSATEGIYVQNMEMILREYKEQVSGFRQEVAELRSENKRIKQEFREFKDMHYKEMEEYLEYINIVDTEKKELLEENAELKLENTELREEISTLKGGNK